MLFFWFFKNCELIRDSSLWRSNFIHLVHDSIVIIGSRPVYTFGSRFTYKRWVRVLSKIGILASWASIPIFLLGLKACRLRFATYSNIFVGSQSVSIEVRIKLSLSLSLSQPYSYPWWNFCFVFIVICGLSFRSVLCCEMWAFDLY